MTKAELTGKILTAGRLKGLNWDEITRTIGGASKRLETAACLGRMKILPYKVY